MSIPINDIVTMPAFSSYYPMPPARYIGVRKHIVFFRAKIDAVNRILPDCFEPSEDGLCAVSGLTVPWSANYGEFQESYLTVKCSYRLTKIKLFFRFINSFCDCIFGFIEWALQIREVV